MSKFITIAHAATRNFMSLVGRPLAVGAGVSAGMHFGVPRLAMMITGNPVIVPVYMTVGAAVVAVAVVEGTLWYMADDISVRSADVAKRAKRLASDLDDPEKRAAAREAAARQGMDVLTFEAMVEALRSASTENTKQADKAA